MTLKKKMQKVKNFENYIFENHTKKKELEEYLNTLSQNDLLEKKLKIIKIKVLIIKQRLTI